MAHFLPTGLLYAPVTTHASLQYECLKSLIYPTVKYFKGTKHLFTVEPSITVLRLAKALLGLVVVVLIAVAWSLLSAAKAVLRSGLWLFAALFFIDAWVTLLAVWAAFLATATSAVCVHFQA